MLARKELMLLISLLGAGCTQPQEEAEQNAPSETTDAGDAEEPELSETGAARYLRQEEFQAPFGNVLIGEYGYADGDAGHATPGRLDVSYLIDGKPRRDFKRAVEVGSSGRLAEWDITYKFTENPTIYASGGFTNMGSTEGCRVLTELTADGPREIATIPDYSGGTAQDGKDYATEGKIDEIEKGKSFKVTYRGSQSGHVVYRWVGKRFQPQASPILEHCGFE
jgi:hypothetical protein